MRVTAIPNSCKVGNDYVVERVAIWAIAYLAEYSSDRLRYRVSYNGNEVPYKKATWLESPTSEQTGKRMLEGYILTNTVENESGLLIPVWQKPAEYIQVSSSINSAFTT